MGDDFSRLPSIGGQALIFQVGCGWLEDGQWRFGQWTTDRLTVEAEGDMLDAFVRHVRALCARRGIDLDDARLFHWSAAETSFLDTAYNAARGRHAERDWPPTLPWFDLLARVVREAPVTVTGAFNFGLKSIAKAMCAAGLIETTWGDGPTDGLGAMVSAWRVDEDARATGGKLVDDPLMVEVAAYNQVDCRVMAEILEWLRGHR